MTQDSTPPGPIFKAGLLHTRNNTSIPQTGCRWKFLTDRCPNTRVRWYYCTHSRLLRRFPCLSVVSLRSSTVSTTAKHIIIVVFAIRQLQIRQQQGTYCVWSRSVADPPVLSEGSDACGVVVTSNLPKVRPGVRFSVCVFLIFFSPVLFSGVFGAPAIQVARQNKSLVYLIYRYLCWLLSQACNLKLRYAIRMRSICMLYLRTRNAGGNDTSHVRANRCAPSAVWCRLPRRFTLRLQLDRKKLEIEK